MSVAQDAINHAEYIRKLRAAGGAATKQVHSDAPPVDAGLFDYDAWAEGVAYEIGDLFTYNGQAGFVRQAHTSQSTWLPFSVGTESLYGARPRQKPDGTYPYLYNMKVEVEMKVWSVKDGQLYRCIQAADPLLYDPADVPAHFELESEG